MYELIIFYIITSQYPAEVNYIHQNYQTEELCKSGERLMLENLRNLTKEVKIESACSLVKM
jgi:hypothetical protein